MGGNIGYVYVRHNNPGAIGIAGDAAKLHQRLVLVCATAITVINKNNMPIRYFI
jgi:hypothetical protein